MNRDSKKSAEFKRYRQLLTGLYLVVAGLGALLLLASVLSQAIAPARAGRRAVGDRIPAKPSPSDLLTCNREVGSLLSDLGDTAGELLGVPGRTGLQEVGSRWERFSTAWSRRWSDTDDRCRFSELKDGNLGIAYDRMAQVHEDLDAMRLKYQALLDRFEEEQGPELSAMRQALDKSHKVLQKRVPAAR